MGIFLMRFAVVLLALSLFAQDASAPHVTADDRATALQLDRDRLAANLRANGIVMKAQQDAAKIIADAERLENEELGKLEARYGCKIDLKTADCIPAAKK